jgi:hypothetical protein
MVPQERPAEDEAEASRATLAQLVAAGDVGPVISLLWRQYHRVLVARGLGRRLSYEDAQEAVQIAFGRMAEQWATFDGGDARSWLWTLHRYEMLTHAQARSRAAMRFEAQENDGASADDPRLVLDGQRLLDALETYILALDPIGRAILDATAEDVTDHELVERIEQQHQQRFSLAALKKRRQRLRDSLNRMLHERGLR